MTLDVLLAVLFAALLHATWNALIKSGRDKLLDVIVLCAAGALLAAPLLYWLPLPVPASWPYLAASVAIHVVYFTLVGLGYRSADMSFIYPLTRGSAPLFTAVIALILLGEAPAFSGWLGVVLLSASVITLALDGRRAANVPARAWVIGFANAAIIVAYTVIDGAGVRVAGNAWSYVLWLFALTGPPLLALGFALRGRAMLSMPLAVWGKGALGAACSIAAYGIALWAMTRAPIALVAALRETSVLFGTAIAALVLHEKFGGQRWVAAGLVAAGAVALKLA